LTQIFILGCILGLDTIHFLTATRKFELRIDLQDWQNETAFASYRQVMSATTCSCP